jgi:hypothetical protein
MNRRGELGVNHGSKSLIYRENLATRSHEVIPGIARDIIDKYNIVAMAPLRSEGSQTPYTLECIKSKGRSDMEVLVG